MLPIKYRVFDVTGHILILGKMGKCFFIFSVIARLVAVKFPFLRGLGGLTKCRFCPRWKVPDSGQKCSITRLVLEALDVVAIDLFLGMFYSWKFEVGEGSANHYRSEFRDGIRLNYSM